MTLVNLDQPTQVAHILREFSAVCANPGTPMWLAARDAADAIDEAVKAEIEEEP